MTMSLLVSKQAIYHGFLVLIDIGHDNSPFTKIWNVASKGLLTSTASPSHELSPNKFPSQAGIAIPTDAGMNGMWSCQGQFRQLSSFPSLQLDVRIQSWILACAFLFVISQLCRLWTDTSCS